MEDDLKRTWEFTSPNNWFKFALPEHWSEYDDDDDSTNAFFNTKEWSGNLRVTALKIGNDKTDTAGVDSLIRSEFKKNPGAILLQLAGHDSAFYVQDTNEETVTYFWIAGLDNLLLICSFGIDKETQSTERQAQELKTVEDMLNTVKAVV